MSVFIEEDTIAAVATPPGEGGIAVLRISGPKAISIADSCFRGKVALVEAGTHTLHFGEFFSREGEPLDQVVASVFRAPHSYTGEETVELSCHGGAFVSRRILDVLAASGARIAGPGEFTKRAFLNGRIDLAQAEAVADLIRARSEHSRKASLDQLEGKLSTRINDLREQLLRTSGLLELELDFSEEGLEFVDKTYIIKEIDAVETYLNTLVESYSVGKVYRDGVKVVIVGRPNAGKSSLLNHLLNENRAIVTDIPGTTRDVIEESIIINGVLFRLVDTAGIREGGDAVESEGIRRSSVQLASADIVILLTDPTQQSDPSDEVIRGEALSSVAQDHLIEVETKSDLSAASRALPGWLRISSVTGAGIQELRSVLSAIAKGTKGGEAIVLTSERHKDICQRAIASLRSARSSLQHGASNELVAVDLRVALDSLGEIVGSVTSEDVLNGIFGKFCIGK